MNIDFFTQARQVRPAVKNRGYPDLDEFPMGKPQENMGKDGKIHENHV